MNHRRSSRVRKGFVLLLMAAGIQCTTQSQEGYPQFEVKPRDGTSWAETQDRVGACAWSDHLIFVSGLDSDLGNGGCTWEGESAHVIDLEDLDVVHVTEFSAAPDGVSWTITPLLSEHELLLGILNTQEDRAMLRVFDAMSGSFVCAQREATIPSLPETSSVSAHSFESRCGENDGKVRAQVHAPRHLACCSEDATGGATGLGGFGGLGGLGGLGGAAASANQNSSEMEGECVGVAPTIAGNAMCEQAGPCECCKSLGRTLNRARDQATRDGLLLAPYKQWRDGVTSQVYFWSGQRIGRLGVDGPSAGPRLDWPVAQVDALCPQGVPCTTSRVLVHHACRSGAEQRFSVFDLDNGIAQTGEGTRGNVAQWDARGDTFIVRFTEPEQDGLYRVYVGTWREQERKVEWKWLKLSSPPHKIGLLKSGSHLFVDYGEKDGWIEVYRVEDLFMLPPLRGFAVGHRVKGNGP